MEHQELIADRTAFGLLRKQSGMVFDFIQRLPGNVFSAPFNHHYAFSHAQLFRRTFPKILTDLSYFFADSAVNYMTLNPDPVEYYFKRFGFFAKDADGLEISRIRAVLMASVRSSELQNQTTLRTCSTPM